MGERKSCERKKVTERKKEGRVEKKKRLKSGKERQELKQSWKSIRGGGKERERPLPSMHHSTSETMGHGLILHLLTAVSERRKE